MDLQHLGLGQGLPPRRVLYGGAIELVQGGELLADLPRASVEDLAEGQQSREALRGAAHRAVGAAGLEERGEFLRQVVFVKGDALAFPVVVRWGLGGRGVRAGAGRGGAAGGGSARVVVVRRGTASAAAATGTVASAAAGRPVPRPAAAVAAPTTSASASSSTSDTTSERQQVDRRGLAHPPVPPLFCGSQRDPLEGFPRGVELVDDAVRVVGRAVVGDDALGPLPRLAGPEAPDLVADEGVDREVGGVCRSCCCCCCCRGGLLLLLLLLGAALFALGASAATAGGGGSELLAASSLAAAGSGGPAAGASRGASASSCCCCCAGPFSCRAGEARALRLPRAGAAASSSSALLPRSDPWRRRRGRRAALLGAAPGASVFVMELWRGQERSFEGGKKT